jgi:hypothetical protein
MNGLNGSAIKYVLALSGVTFADGASSNPFNIGDTGRWLNVLAQANSAQAVFKVLRSATSNGTFNETGLSLAPVASALVVRSMPLQSSATWYKLSYDNTGGSTTATVIFEVQGQRNVPIATQDTNTTVLSDVIA